MILKVSTPEERLNYLGRKIEAGTESGVSEPQIWCKYRSDFSCTWRGGRGSLSAGFHSIALVCFLVLMNPLVKVHSFTVFFKLTFDLAFIFVLFSFASSPLLPTSPIPAQFILSGSQLALN